MKNNIQHGGNEKVIPHYIEPNNNPGIPNQQKEINAIKYGEQQAKVDKYKSQQQNNNFIDFKVSLPDKPKPKQDSNNMNIFPSFNTNPYFPAQMSNMFAPYGSSMLGAMYPMAVNVNKIYEINASGPVSQHTRLNMIYEDLIPGRSISTTFKTLGERITQIQYIRTILFDKGDGKETNLDGIETNSLLSHIKFLELNPFNSNRHSDNPYKGLPDGFLIYRTCYPIKRSEPFGKAECSKDSMSINIRIYKLNTGGYLINKQNNSKFYEYEQWREIAFYEYIREHILKKKICPNFVSLYGYYLCKQSKIQFDRITEINTEKKQLNPPFNNLNDLNVFDKKQNDFVGNVVKGLRELNPGNIIQRLSTDNQLQNIQIPTTTINDLQQYCGEVIVAMTESPTHTLYNWASKIYQQEGNTRRMINTGFYKDEVWRSIIFQLMVALYTMKIHNIYIKDFSVKNNVFIKDLNTDGPLINYWKYRIRGIDYYIPNYGYLVLIDSNYKDLNSIPGETFTNTQQKTYKLDGKLFDIGNTIESNSDDKFNEMFKACINPNNFGPDFVSDGGTQPNQEILSLLSSMSNDTEIDNEQYFIKYMSKFMNNRIGTYLKEQEIVHIRNDDLRNFKRGQLLVSQEGTGIYKFVLYLDTIDGKAIILTKDRTSQNDPQYIDKDNEIIIQKEVQITILSNYSLTESIVQNYKINESNLNEENILETYNIVV